MQKISQFCLIIFVGIYVSWDGLAVSRLPISFKISSLVTCKNVNIEMFLYLSSIVKMLGCFREFMIASKVGSLTSSANDNYACNPKFLVFKQC